MKQLLITFFLLSGLTLGQNVTDATKQLKNLPQAVQAQVSTHNLSVPANCIAHSGSATAYTCATTPTFTPAVGDHIQFEADVANTGTATLAVNGAAAATIHKQGGSVVIVANDLLAGHWISATFDGTYWQLEGQLGNAASTSPCTVTGVGSSSTCAFPGSVVVGATNPVTIGGSCPSPTGKVANADGTGCSALPTVPSNITTQGNTFNGASQLVQMTSGAKLPAVDGSLLINLPSISGAVGGVDFQYAGIASSGMDWGIAPIPYPAGLSVATNCAGSVGKAEVAAGASTVITLYKVPLGSLTGTSFGTMTFAASAFEATFTCTATTFAFGDSIHPNGGGDNYLQGVHFDVIGTR